MCALRIIWKRTRIIWYRRQVQMEVVLWGACILPQAEHYPWRETKGQVMRAYKMLVNLSHAWFLNYG